MKKLLPLVILLILLLSGCGPNLPYKVWDDFDHMKKVLGDHFLYPSYIPEGFDDITIRSTYNSLSFKERAKDPYFGYSGSAYTDGDYPIFSFSVTDPSLKRTTMEGSPKTYEREVTELRTENIMEIKVSITTVYLEARTTSVKFEINGILYEVEYQAGKVTDKNTDPSQLEELLKVAKSIIEQTREDE